MGYSFCQSFPMYWRWCHFLNTNSSISSFLLLSFWLIIPRSSSALPWMVKWCLSCQYSICPRSPLYIGPAVLPQPPSPPPPPSLFCFPSNALILLKNKPKKKKKVWCDKGRRGGKKWVKDRESQSQSNNTKRMSRSFGLVSTFSSGYMITAWSPQTFSFFAACSSADGRSCKAPCSYMNRICSRFQCQLTEYTEGQGQLDRWSMEKCRRADCDKVCPSVFGTLPSCLSVLEQILNLYSLLDAVLQLTLNPSWREERRFLYTDWNKALQEIRNKSFPCSKSS